MFVSFQDFLVKQATFLYEAWPDSAEKRYIFNTDFDIRKEFDIEDLFISELLMYWLFQTVKYLWEGGKGE